MPVIAGLARGTLLFDQQVCLAWNGGIFLPVVILYWLQILSHNLQQAVWPLG